MNIVEYLRGKFLTRKHGQSESEPEPSDGPRYGASVSYMPCPDCGEGSLIYDEDADASVCSACGAVDDGPAS